MFLWLDDIRNPNENGAIGAVWAKTYEEAICFLETGEVNIASLDHDLTCNEKTGYDVICWIEEHNVWPNEVYVHSANPSGKLRMLQAIQKHYGKLFQPPYYL